MKKLFLSWALGLIVGGTMVVKVLGNYCEKITKEKQKFEHYYFFLADAIKETVCLSQIFEQKKIKSVAIYGYGNVAESVRNILKRNGVETKYFIDKAAQSIQCECKVYSIQEEWPEVDAIIIVPVNYKEEISNLIKNKAGYLTIPLEKVLS